MRSNFITCLKSVYPSQVTGNTIYNMLEMESLEVDSNDRPTYPPTIYSSEVMAFLFEIQIEPTAQGEQNGENHHHLKWPYYLSLIL